MKTIVLLTIFAVIAVQLCHSIDRSASPEPKIQDADAGTEPPTTTTTTPKPEDPEAKEGASSSSKKSN